MATGPLAAGHIRLRLINPSRHGEREHVVDVALASTVVELKRRLVLEHAGSPTLSEQRLFYRGRQLDDEETFATAFGSALDLSAPIALHLHIPRSRSNSAASPRPSPVLRAQSAPQMPRSPLLGSAGASARQAPPAAPAAAAASPAGASAAAAAAAAAGGSAVAAPPTLPLSASEQIRSEQIRAWQAWQLQQQQQQIAARQRVFAAAQLHGSFSSPGPASRHVSATAAMAAATMGAASAPTSPALQATQQRFATDLAAQIAQLQQVQATQLQFARQMQAQQIQAQQQLAMQTSTSAPAAPATTGTPGAAPGAAPEGEKTRAELLDQIRDSFTTDELNALLASPRTAATAPSPQPSPHDFRGRQQQQQQQQAHARQVQQQYMQQQMQQQMIARYQMQMQQQAMFAQQQQQQQQRAMLMQQQVQVHQRSARYMQAIAAAAAPTDAETRAVGAARAGAERELVERILNAQRPAVEGAAAAPAARVAALGRDPNVQVNLVILPPNFRIFDLKLMLKIAVAVVVMAQDAEPLMTQVYCAAGIIFYLYVVP